MNVQKLGGALLIIAVIGFAAAYAFLSNPGQSEATDDAGTAAPPVISETVEAPPANTVNTAASANPDNANPDNIEINIEQAMAPRVLGAPDAPVTIEEFASFSCGHCATFHINTFPELKEKYIDTGKVRFIFTDFPLNAPALDASIIARCLPEDKFFRFIKFLFDTQEDWAFSGRHRQALTQNAKLLGISDERLDACMKSVELRAALMAQMQVVSQNQQIQSTPSFIINGTETIRGAQSFNTFRTIIEKILKESQTTE